MINYDLKSIKALAFDVDGVLSSSTIPLIGDGGFPSRTANIKDGYALQLAVKSGLQLAIITGGNSQSVKLRYEGLGVQHIYLQAGIKIKCFSEWMNLINVKPSEVLYMGDDIPDYEVMIACGCPCAPADAADEIKRVARYVSGIKGGCGCVRDVVEQVLKAQGHWMAGAKAFGW